MLVLTLAIACSDETNDGGGENGGSGGSTSSSSSGTGTGGRGGGATGHDHGTGTSGTHIHSVQFFESSKSLIVGTHDGLFRTEAGTTELLPVFEGPDFMGFLQNPFSPTSYWGSGHNPGDGLGNWGWVQSVDSGASWSEVSLSGVADFHEMAVSPDMEGAVAGHWNGELYASSDGGANWSSYAWPSDVHGMEIANPAGPVLLLASAAGIDEVTLPAISSSTIVSAAVTSLDRHGDGYVYATSDGQLHLCDAQLAACQTVAGPGGAIGQVLSDPDDPASLYVLTTASDVFHTEGDGSWELLIDGN
jgi:hypothetical protein